MALSPISATHAVTPVGAVGPRAAAQAPQATPPQATAPQAAAPRSPTTRLTYQVPSTPTQKVTDEQTESALVRAREAETSQDAAIPIQSKGNLVNIRV